MIKNLLFDLGGVIMNICRQRCADAFSSAGIECVGDLLGDDYTQAGAFLRLESGLLSPSEFRDVVRKMLPKPIKDEEIDNILNLFLMGIPVYRLKALRKLREKYGVYLLSNTNPIMWNSKIAEEFKQEGYTIDDYFDGIVTSFEAKSSKPDKNIFIYAINKLKIKPEETLFLDDSQKNLDTARTLGFKVRLVRNGMEFIDLISAEK